MKNICGLFLLLSLLTISCSRAAQTDANGAPLDGASSPLATKLTADQVINAFSSAKLPLNNLVIFKTENDPDKLLGRPNQYIEKARWGDDTRAVPVEIHSLEIFKTAGDLAARKAYVDSITQSVPDLAEYSITHKNVLLRLHRNLPPDLAGKYESVLKAL